MRSYIYAMVQHLASVVQHQLFSLKDFFSRTARPISTKLGRKHSWMMGIQICSNKARGKIRKILINIQKTSSHELLARMHCYFVWSILGARRFKIVQIKSLGSQMTMPEEDIFLYVAKSFKNLLLNEPLAWLH